MSHFVASLSQSRNSMRPFLPSTRDVTLYLENTMRKVILAAVAVLAIGSAAAGMLIAEAQPAPPSASGASPDGPRRMEGWMHRMRDWREGRGPIAPGTFALVYGHEDRQLTPQDVQKIAEAFLLWRGNHTWKVANVKPSDSGISFDITTGTGEVIASFTMDPHSGRVTRTG